MKKHEGFTPWFLRWIIHLDDLCRHEMKGPFEKGDSALRTRNFDRLTHRLKRPLCSPSQPSCEDKPVSVWETCFPKRRQAGLLRRSLRSRAGRRLEYGPDAMMTRQASCFMVKTTLNMFARVPHRAVFGTTGVIDRPVGYNGSGPRENIL